MGEKGKRKRKRKGEREDPAGDSFQGPWKPHPELEAYKVPEPVCFSFCCFLSFFLFCCFVLFFFCLSFFVYLFFNLFFYLFYLSFFFWFFFLENRREGERIFENFLTEYDRPKKWLKSIKRNLKKRKKKKKQKM